MKRERGFAMIKFMKIDREDVRHLAELARLKLTETELEKFKKEATEIVGFFDELGGVGEREGEEREEEDPRRHKRESSWPILPEKSAILIWSNSSILI